MNREFDTWFSSSSLLCQEVCFTETTRECHKNVDLNNYKSCFVSDSEDDEYIKNLVLRETDVRFKTNPSLTDPPSTSTTWLHSARLGAIEWIFNTRETFGFQAHTAYLSVTYFDRFITTRSFDEGKMWAIRLLSIACLSLAAKIEECKVPVLSEFRTQDYHFDNKVIQRMELLVLTTLEWKMSSVTPFSYLHYFIRQFHGESESSNPKGLISKSVELIITIIKEFSVMHYRPSIIAAAAVLAASDCTLTKKAMELKIDCISLWGSLQSGDVLICYNMMQEIEMRKCKTPKFVISSDYSSVHNVVVDEGISDVRHGGGTKRILTFNESDQNSLAKKICRP